MKFPDVINPYAYAMSLRRMLYKKEIFKSEKVSVPVISIGNLSMGGTGKTPVTLHIAKYCIGTLGKKTAIILRGYKRKSSGYLLVSDGKTILETIHRSGDEAQMYAQEIPGAIVICDEDRVEGSKKAVALGVEVILLDDAFQHLLIKRDLNILLINSDEGNPAVLPFGRGRETKSAISDADIIIETNSEKNKKAIRENSVRAITKIGRIGLYGSNGSQEKSTDFFRGKKNLAFAGIAHPENFKKSLVPFALSVLSFPLPDHAEYSKTLLDKIIAKAKSEGCDLIVTTTKDAVKMLDQYRAMLQQDSTLPALAIVHTEIEFISGEDILFEKINRLFTR